MAAPAMSVPFALDDVSSARLPTVAVLFGHADVSSTRPPAVAVLFGLGDVSSTRPPAVAVLFGLGDVSSGRPSVDRVLFGWGDARQPAGCSWPVGCRGQCATLTHMARVGVRELRQRASALLRRVAAGEVIEVSDRGQAVAAITRSGPRGLAKLEEEGLLRPGVGDLLAVTPVRLPPGVGPTSEGVIEDRSA